MSLTSTPSLKTPYDAFMLLPCFDIMEMIGKEVVQKRLDLDRDYWMELRSQCVLTGQVADTTDKVSSAPWRDCNMTAVKRIKFYGGDYLEYVREFECDNPPPEVYARGRGGYSRYPGSAGSFIEYCFHCDDFDSDAWCVVRDLYYEDAADLDSHDWC